MIKFLSLYNNLKETVPFSMNTSNSQNFSFFFDSPEHNFNSWATKRLGWPDLCHSKPLAKLKQIEKEI